MESSCKRCLLEESHTEQKSWVSRISVVCALSLAGSNPGRTWSTQECHSESESTAAGGHQTIIFSAAGSLKGRSQREHNSMPHLPLHPTLPIIFASLSLGQMFIGARLEESEDNGEVENTSLLLKRKRLPSSRWWLTLGNAKPVLPELPMPQEELDFFFNHCKF